MELANLIMAGNQQVTNYGMQIGKDLASLGEKIGLKLADDRNKKQATAMMPGFQSAMSDFENNNSAAGYNKLLTAAAQDPSNPYVQNLVQLGFIGGKAIDDDRYKSAMAAASAAKVTTGESGAQRLGITGGTGTVATDRSKIPVDQTYLVNNVNRFRGLTPEEKQQELNSSTTQEQSLKGYKTRTITGLSEIYPQLNDTLFYPEIGSRVKQTISTSDKPGSPINFSFSEVDTGEELFNLNSKAIDALPSAINVMTKQAPIGSKETFSELFKRNGGIENAIISPAGYGDNFLLKFQGNDKDKYQITKTQAEKLGIVQSIPALSGSGIVLQGRKKQESEEMFPVRQQAPTQQAEQPAGQPAGQQVVAPAQPATQVSAPSKPAEFSNEQNPFFEAAQRSQVSSASKGGGRAGRTGEGRAKQIQAEIDSIDKRIKTIENRRGSPQDKYRAFEMLSAERKKLQSELSKFSK